MIFLAIGNLFFRNDEMGGQAIKKHLAKRIESFCEMFFLLLVFSAVWLVTG